MRSLILKRVFLVLVLVVGLTLVGCGTDQPSAPATDNPERESDDRPLGQSARLAEAGSNAPAGPTKNVAGLSMDRYYLTLDTYKIDPRYLDEPGVTLGVGVDLRDPDRPLVAPCHAFVCTKERIALKAEAGSPVSGSSVTESTRLLDSLSEADEATVLSTHFKASYMLSSVEAAAKVSRQNKNTCHTIYMLLEHAGEARRLPASERKWAPDEVPISESLDDDDEALRQFISRYGTHYISSIRYGLRIGVQGKLKSTESKAAEAFSVAFKAAFGSFGAEGDMSKDHSTELTAENVDLLLEATTGGREGGALLVARGFTDIKQFLGDLKDGKIKYHVAPLEVTLKPYWPTLDPKWERTRALLDPQVSFKVPGAPYGVPTGTIVAWHPTPDYVKIPAKPPKGVSLPEDESDEEPTLVPPPGWAICDGTNGTPDLRGRFLRSTAAYASLGHKGGREKHGHGTHTHTTMTTTNLVGMKSGSFTKHDVSKWPHAHKMSETAVPEAEHLPPYVELVYIMKLKE